jgi:heat shock protein HslJ
VNRRALAVLLTSLVATVVVVGCGAKNQMAEVTANPWVVQQVLTSNGHQPVLQGTTPVIAFIPDGTVVGNLSVDSFRGPYTLQARNIHIGPVVTTQWSGHEQELIQDKTIANCLASASRYVVKNGVLELSDNSGNLLLKCGVGQEPTLVGPNWRCTSYAGPGGMVSVVGTDVVSASFAPDGSLAGYGGLNGFSTTYKVSGSTMTIAPITSTKKAGPEDLMAQESAYLAAMEKTATFRIAGYELTLLDSSGATLAEYVPFSPKD